MPTLLSLEAGLERPTQRWSLGLAGFLLVACAGSYQGAAAGGEPPRTPAALAVAPSQEPSVESLPASAPTGEEPGRAPTLLWRAGSALAAAPAIGPDGAVYIAGRQGTLDVIEASGQHRFTVTLGGAPTGAMFVDERGWAYVGLATGKLVGITPVGQKFFAFQSPKGIRGGVGFAEGQGLLILGHDEVVVGVNRGGFPTMRMAMSDRVTAGPIGVSGWCVVGTAKGELLWGNRWGKRQRAEVGRAPRELQPTVDGGIWALGEDKLFAFSARRGLVFQRDHIVAIATVPAKPSSPEVMGALLTSGFEVEWLDGSGNRVASSALETTARPSFPAVMRLDAEHRVWIAAQDGRLGVFGVDGDSELRDEFAGRNLLEPVFDAARRRTVIATVEGEVFELEWRQAPHYQAGR